MKTLSTHRTDWTIPVNTKDSGVEWRGTIVSINSEEKIVEIKGENKTIKVALLPETSIEDKEGRPLFLDTLKLENFVAITGTYQMAGKITPNWEVIIVAEKIKVLGNCVKEGEEKISDIECCPVLYLLTKNIVLNVETPYVIFLRTKKIIH